MAKIVLHTEGSSKEFPIGDELTIGRHASCTIFIDEPRASRRHARITSRAGRFELADLESSNGTKVNGKKIETHTLAHGDTIQIGATRMVFDAPELPRHSAESKRIDATPKAKRSTDDPLVGTTLGGFKVLARIGQGGMGTVYEALQVSLDRQVAVKVLKPELARDRGFAKEFIHEARAAGKFQHPGLVEIHDVNESQGVLYYSMELVDGESAMEKLKRKGKLELTEALDIGIGVAEVLVQLEKEEAVHQDIKPHNILLLNDGKIKLTDFGLATIGGRIRRIAVDPDSILGTPHYMSPEQASRAKRVTTKADLYGLGCTLFHLLTGKVPFEGNSALVVLAKHANQTRPDAHEKNPDVPDILAELLRQMMAIEADERPENAQEVLDALKRIKTGLARTAGVQPIRPGPSGGSRRRPASESAPTSPLNRMDPVAARVIQLGVIGVMLVLGFQLARVAVAGLDFSTSHPPAPPAPRPDPDGTSQTNWKPPRPPPTPDTGTSAQNGDGNNATKTPEVSSEAEAAFKVALERRDRAMTSGNFSGARSAISDFRRAFPDGEISRRAQQIFDETGKEIGLVCQQIFTEADTAAKGKNYRLAAAKCTRLISADPRSAFADRARALMGRIDLETQGRYDQARAVARKALDQGKLPDASRAISAALDELGGTKWAEALLAQQLHILMAGQYLKNMETTRQTIAAKGKPINLIVPDLGGVKKSGVLIQINDLMLKTELGGVTLSYSLATLTTPEIRRLAAQLGLAEQHLGLSNLLSILNRTGDAQKEFESALKVPAQAMEIERLSLSQAGLANLHRYDFSKWEHQSDWEAPSGAWSTKNDQYVLESTDGGDTFLKPDAIRGGFQARNGRIGFEFIPGQRNEGYYISAEFGDERRNVTLLFTSTGWELQISADEQGKAQGRWSVDPTKVELAIDTKDTLTLSLNGKIETSVEVKGLSSLKGTLSFHARETACAFDNIILRTQE